ncbi:MAG TPA: class I SAM-dependent methyltransferase [Gemmatimonadaceae bacterium]|nr:class I SAM-dependent methyltransferase [Gemmatimonadaceae bacterium]
MSDVSDARDDRSHWEARYAERGPELDRGSSPWVIQKCLTLPRSATIVDLAGGVGRHAEPLALQGFRVVVVDFIPRAVATAVARHARVDGVVADVRALPLRAQSVDAIMIVSFLDRSVLPVIVDALAPGGVLVYETFTIAHLEVVERGAARGPRNPTYLLQPGELPRLVAPLEVQEHAEGLVIDSVGERHVARVMAVKR